MQHIVEHFYQSFATLDAEQMCRCYHQDAVFHDDAFGTLSSSEVKAMWRMLIASQKGKDFRITYRDITVDGDHVSAHWEAHYIFSRTGRRVHNIIEAEILLKDGKIYRHTDHFDVHRWAKQALGWKGWLLGGTSFFKKKLQEQTSAALKQWKEQELSNSH